MRAWLMAVVWLCAGCAAAGDPERQGDQAYGQARYAEALKRYRGALAGNPDPRVWAKAGAAALHSGELREAAESYLKLAGDDPTRVLEAAEGLEAVVLTAERQRNAEVLGEALAGLQAIAPGRPTGRYAVLLAQQAGTGSAELVALLPGAIAAATDANTVDSLLASYGRALEQTAGCGQAILLYRSVLRRAEDARARLGAHSGVADCSLALGERARGAGNDEEAALWFAEAARMDSTSATGRLALLGYGDARLRQGDPIAAALAFQALVAAAEPDSIAAAAAARLQSLDLSSSAGDSSSSDFR
ncbi:MAG: hypothetical protein H0T44_07345 [Gemmatimonadales bacterium]|nr:hypothetical protein [Gemmatimonadales bacterium]